MIQTRFKRGADGKTAWERMNGVEMRAGSCLIREEGVLYEVKRKRKLTQQDGSEMGGRNLYGAHE